MPNDPILPDGVIRQDPGRHSASAQPQQVHHHPHHCPHHPHDGGLAQDLMHLRRGMTRRQLAFGLLAGSGGFLAGLPRASHAQPASSSTTSSCPVIPSATAGPFPANGSGWLGKGVNALALAGVSRRDIRPNFGGVPGVAGGVPMSLTLALVNSNAGCATLADLAVYVWQCDAQGRYSMYSSGVKEQNYLRGVQTTRSDGTVTFQTIVPGCYDGRMPHLHFEVYRQNDLSSTEPLSSSKRLKTSQIALPTEACETVYQQARGYGDSARQLSRLNFATDGIFRDGVELQMARLSGSVGTGFAASLQVGIAA